MFKKKRHKIIKILERTFIVLAVIAITALAVRATDKKLNKNNTGDLDSLNNGCPLDMVYVTTDYGGFCIDKYEASAGLDCPYSDPASQNESLVNVDYRQCLPVSTAGREPWRNLSQNQAALACAKAGKRLPTNKEWQAAVLGTPDPMNEPERSGCQIKENWRTGVGLTGMGKNCMSAAGAYDMVGNAWEWVDGTITDRKYGDKLLPESGYIAGVDSDGFPVNTKPEPDVNYYGDYAWLKGGDTKGIARGGYWDNGKEAGQYSIYAVLAPSAAGPGIGFRCAK